MRRILFLLGLIVAHPAAAEDFWVLHTGPEAVAEVPLNPVQPVSSWRGLYTDGEVRIWVYVTQSPYFFPPATPQARRIDQTPWSVVVFFPVNWTPGQQKAWLDGWATEFRTLQSLPDRGWPVLFPSILPKG